MKANKPPLFPERVSINSETDNDESSRLISSSRSSLHYVKQNHDQNNYGTNKENDNINIVSLNNRLWIGKNKKEDDDADDNTSTKSIFSHAAFWYFQNLSSSIIPSNREIVEDSDDEEDDTIEDDKEDDDSSQEIRKNRIIKPYPKRKRVIFLRSLRRRTFLLLTEPQSSIASAIFFIFLILMIALSNVLMMMQTCNKWSFTPSSCLYCSSNDDDELDDNVQERFYDQMKGEDFGGNVECVCPPMPLPSLVYMEDVVIAFFAIEWTLRVFCYDPPSLMIRKKKKNGRHLTFFSSAIILFQEWMSFLFLPSTLFDALAIFPYYLEEINEINGFLSLRLLRLFRVFQLLRLGQYNVTFMTLRNVLYKSILCLNVLMIVLIFGAAFFGSIIFWLEKGTWKYTTYSDPPSFMYMRLGADGITEEPSPFTSIPAAFWWFIVTATTVGYGDVFPTSLAGKLVGTSAMLTGVLVIAFPVSVFSDLWSKELKKVGIFDLDEVGDINSQSSFDVDPSEQKDLAQSISLPQLSSGEKSNAEADFTTYHKDTVDASNQNSSLKLTSTFLGFGDLREFNTALCNMDSSTDLNKSKNQPNGKKRPHRRCSSDITPTMQKSTSDIDDFVASERELEKKQTMNLETSIADDTTNISNFDLLGLDFLEKSPLQQQRKTNADFTLSANDMNLLRRHLASIDESQKVIRSILGEK